MAIRDAAPADMARILILNNAEAEAVNALDERSLAEISEQSFAFLASGDPVDAFLLALSHETPPRGPNHAWFLAREPKFVYVDRVLVSASVQGRGLGRELYAALKERARAAGIGMLCCEVNLMPLNLKSLAFHERLGFVPAGEATDPRNAKRVRYLVRNI
jgi:predicted GNAT superfamily acetyltransferase